MKEIKKQKSELLSIIKTFFLMLRLGIPRWFLCFLGVIFIGMSSYFFSLLTGMLLASSLDHFAEGTSSVYTILLILAVLFLSTCFMTGGYILNLHGALGIRADIQRRLISAWIKQTEKFALGCHSSESMTIITSDMELVEDFYFQGLMLRLFLPLVQGLAAASTIVAIDWRLLFPPVITGMLSLLLSVKYTNRIQEKNRIERTMADRLTRSFSEVIGGNTALRMLGAVDNILEKYRLESEEYVEKSVDAKRISIRINFISKLFNVISLIMFLGISMWLITAGRITLSVVMLAYPLQSLVGEMMNSFGGTWTYLISATTSGERVLKALTGTQEDPADDLPALESGLSELEFKDVYFAYKENIPVLKGVSFQIKKNQTIALVGASGSGKSTILQLLLRFYDSDQGIISIDGVPSKHCTLNSWRSHFVYLQQDAPILSKTVFENIAMGVYGSGRNPTEVEVIAAAKAAGAHDFIMGMPDAYYTRLDEKGANLSGGQRQRIAIARAFISDAPILLLDEPTAALDLEAERLIQKSLDTLMKEKTVFVVAHRLKTIKNADLILVLENGSIKEQGNHDKLINANGLYTQLYHNQLI